MCKLPKKTSGRVTLDHTWFYLFYVLPEEAILLPVWEEKKKKAYSIAP